MSDPSLSVSPTRRTVLKSVAVGGAGLAVWSVPVIEVFSMTHATAEVVSGGPEPSFSIDPTSITAPDDPTEAAPPATATSSGAGGLGAGDPGGAPAAVAAAAGRSQLAATGVNLPVGTATAVAAGAIATGVAAVVLGNRTGGAANAAGGDVVDVPKGSRRH